MPILLRRRPVRILCLLVFAGIVFLAISRAQGPTPIVVNTTADHEDGSCDPLPSTCTLREAINTANFTPGLDSIIFEIPGAGVETIAPTTALPTITEAVTIDGYTQPGASENTLAEGNDAVLMIELNGAGAGAGADGLSFASSQISVRGLVINRFEGAGIVVSRDGASDSNTIQGCFIGTNAAGTADLGNVMGIELSSFLDTIGGNTVGGATPEARNLISGNGIGVQMGTSDNIIAGNYIGTDADGTLALGNTSFGISLISPAIVNTTIGGTTAGARNIISANSTGIRVTGSNTSIQGNYIGLDATGTLITDGAGNSLGNGTAGISFNFFAGTTFIGGLTPTPGVAPGNVIAGNGIGIDCPSSAPATGTLIRGNLIGTEVTGTLNRGNTGPGLRIATTDVTVGGTTNTASNIIAFNGGDGIEITNTPTNISIQRNSIFSNTGLGIDLASDGVTLNDTDDTDTGLNNQQNFPVITAIVGNNIIGTFDAIPDTNFTLEFFESTVADPSGFGEGQTLLTSQPVRTNAPGGADVNFSFSVGAPITGFVTATATNLSTGDTSEFSVAVRGPQDFDVNSAADTDDGACTTGANGCTLREAINAANARAGADTINFDIPGVGVRTIAPATDLPVITSPVTMDGYTQPSSNDNDLALTAGSNAVLLVEINATGRNFGLSVGAGGDGSTIRGLVVNRAARSGILLASGGNTIAGCYLGVNAPGNAASRNSGPGVEVASGDGNLIGGTTPQARNLISGNDSIGFGGQITVGRFGFTPPTNTRIQGNFIGPNAQGLATILPLASTDGVRILGGNDTLIGGTNVGARNLISGHIFGIEVDAGNGVPLVDGVTIQGNFIGVDRTGIALLPNEDGIRGNTAARTDNLLIGGTAAGAGNVISGNTGSGIQAGALRMTIQGNFIGTDLSGARDLGNGGSSLGGFGVAVRLGGNLGPNFQVLIGGTTAAARNVISGNVDDGVIVTGLQGGAVVVQGNFIGVQADGTTPLPNGGDGVEMNRDIVVGGTAVGAGNVIAFNGGRGVNATTSQIVTVPIQGNSIHSNGSLGIDIGQGGVSGNDLNDTDTNLPNEGQNFPVITGVTFSGGNTIVAGTLNSTASTQFTVELFRNVAADPSGNGEGQTFVARQNVTTDGSGNISFTFTVTGTVAEFFTATATRTVAPLDTSEFSNAVRAPQNFVVDTISDADLRGCTAAPDDCSLRGAINTANVSAGANTISFNIPGVGVQTIAPTSPLPVITDPVTLDGYTQPGASENTLAVGNDAVLLIELNGVSAGNVPGVSITAANSTVRGLIVNNFTGNGIEVLPASTGGNRIEGNFVGINSTGTSAAGNAIGIALYGSNNIAGGTTPAARNVVGGNRINGIGVGLPIGVTNPIPTGNVIQGNYVGTNTAGTAAIPNRAPGIAIAQGTTNNTIGGTDPGAGNLVSGNGANGGIAIFGNSANNVVQGNRIGTNAAGTTAISNDVSGVLLSNAANNNTIGGTTAAAANIIAGNDGTGVLITGAGTDSNLVRGNIIGLNVNGAALGNGDFAPGIRIEDGAKSNIVGGTVAGARNTVSGNGGAGVLIQDGGTTGNLVQGNLLGTNVAGTAAAPNARGVVITNDATNNTVGGITATARNILAGNEYGVLIDGANTSNNTVQGNFIGTNASGAAVIANRFGVGLTGGTTTNTIGGTSAAARNIISGNTDANVFSDGGRNNLIQGNFIGTNTTGTAALDANQTTTAGVWLTNNSAGNTVGGTVAGARNIISGNAGVGVFIQGHDGSGVTPSANNTVQGNFIGANATGAAAVPNGAGGIHLTANTSGNSIGGTTAGARNVVSGNNGSGLLLENTNSNTIQGNFIGVAANGTTVLGNTGANADGITLDNGSRNNLIGGEVAGAGNTIANNGARGILLTSLAGVGNAIRQNLIFNNATLGIDLGTDGVTDNDADDADGGPNLRQNYPVITNATSTTISGTLQSTPSTAFTLDFFSNTAADPTGFGEGEAYLGSVDVTTSNVGNAAFTFEPPGGVPVGQFVTATATDAANNTSEFSQGREVTAAVPLPALTINDVTMAEGNSTTTNAVFTVTLSAASATPVTVDFATANGTATALADYTTTNGTLTFAPGVLQQTVSVPIVGETAIEPNETFFVNLSNATNASIADNQGIGTITDDDGVVRPPNDDFVNAQVINRGAGSLLGYNTNATRQPGEPLHAGINGDTSVWYRWRPTSQGRAQVESSGIGFPSLIGVYTGESVDALTPVTGQRSQLDDNGFLTAITEFQADHDVEYFIAVDGVGGAQNTFALRWTLVPSPVPTPTPTIGPSLYSLSGRVATAFSFGLQGVQVNLSGNGRSVSTKTLSNGQYSIGDLPAGTYTITPIFSHLNFSPPSRTLTVGPSYRRVDFFAYTGAVPAPPPGPEPIGSPNPTATARPTVVPTATAQPTAQPNPTTTSTPTGTAQPIGTPTSVPTTQPTSTQRFRVSGHIATSAGFGLRGITVYLVDDSGAVQAVQTQSGGSYEFTGVAPGVYQVEPAYRGLVFLPELREVQVSNSHQSEIDFIAQLE